MVHHAYYIEGSLSQFDAHKTALKPFWASAFERFGIDECRELIALSSLKNFNPARTNGFVHSGGEAVFLIGAASITSEAQQALLKLFEEPQKGTTFVLLVPHGALLPTLKSRMLPYPELSAVTENSSLYAVQFLKMAGKERSETIAKILKDEEGTKERVRDFVNALEIELVKDIKKNRQGLQDLAMVRDYVGDRAPSLKMLLEHLALSLPTI